jgi:endonuclease VIII
VPEGDTVWNTAHMLHEALAGALIARSDFRVPALATVDLSSWQVQESACRGKHLLLRLTSPSGRALTLHSHLRMDGSWRLYPTGERWRGGPGHLIRAVLSTPTLAAVGYHLHELALVGTAQEESLVGHLGPDLLGDASSDGTWGPGEWDEDEAVRRLATRPERRIAEALLDQRNLAGIGNLYKSEILFLRGVHPATPVSDVDDLSAMAALGRTLLLGNRGRWEQSTTGSLRRGERTYVYGRRGAPCRHCATTVRGEELGERITYWCPRCQP